MCSESPKCELLGVWNELEFLNSPSPPIFFGEVEGGGLIKIIRVYQAGSPNENNEKLWSKEKQ